MTDDQEHDECTGLRRYSHMTAILYAQYLERLVKMGKSDVETAHGHLQALVSLLLQTMKPIGPMRSRNDYPPELARAIEYLKAIHEGRK